MSSPRTFTTGEYDLNCTFMEPFPYIDLGTTMHALWGLFTDRTDYLRNFDNMVLEGSDEDVAFPFHSFYFDGSHNLKTPSGDAGFDLEGLQQVGSVRNAGSSAWGIGFQVMPESFPAPGTYRWVFYVGTLTNHFGFRIHSDGRGEYIRKSESSIESVYTAVLYVDEWHSVYLAHDHSGINTCGVYLNGNLIGAVSTMMVKSAGTGNTDSHPFYLGKGPKYSFSSAPAAWDANKAGGGYTFSADSMTVIAQSTAGYQSCPATGQLTAADKVYWEVVYNSGTYVWAGVAPPTADFSLSPALIGVCFAFHNGRRWNAQTGGGTNWITSTPVGTVVGFAWNGPAGTLTIYRNGVLAGMLPYTITAPVMPYIGSQYACNLTLKAAANAWTYSPPDGTYTAMPGTEVTNDQGDAPFFRGRARLFRICKGYPAIPEIQALAKVDLLPNIYAENGSGQKFYINSAVYKWYTEGQYIGIKTPNIPAGTYSLYAEFNGRNIFLREIIINKFSDLLRGEAFHDDFTDFSALSDNWELANKAWGGNNGGCSAHLVRIKKGEIRCAAYGDLYRGSAIYGVDNRGNPSGKQTRVGSCLVSKHYYKPGIFKFKCKYPKLTGACSAIWVFHYEEAYPSDNLWSEVLSDGLHKSGNSELGHWIVRNHEIDIEIPSALKTDANQEAATYANGRFNTWRGELRNWDVPNNDVPTNDSMYSPTNDPAYWSEYTDKFLPLPGGPINDGEIHELLIDWNTNPEEVKFYIDGTLVTTNTTHVPTIPMKVWFGIWFPSASVKWAGKSADWIMQEFILYDFQYLPHEGAPYTDAPESYPRVGYKPITFTNFQMYPWMTEEVLTMAYCWKLTLQDGTIYGFTNHDKDLTISGVTYEAAAGFVPTAVETSNNMSVDNLEVEGFLDSDRITADDLATGRFDFAKVEIFAVNWANLDDPVLILRKGTIGQVSSGQSGFQAEVRGLMDAYQQTAGKKYQKICRASLGDSHCQINLSAFTFTGTVTVVNDDGTFGTNLSNNTGFFDYGILTWVSGKNAGNKYEVKTYGNTGGVFDLTLPTYWPVNAGDTFAVSAGCDGNFSTCKNRFNNVVNFRAEPHIPGNDYMTSYASQGSANTVTEGEDASRS